MAAMSFFQRFHQRRAAKAYALRLPEALRAGYGPKTHYTPGQVRAAVTKARLDPRFIALGYAAFMTEAAFNEVAGEMPVRMTYAEARATFWGHRQGAPRSRWHNAEATYDSTDVALHARGGGRSFGSDSEGTS